MYEFRKQGLDNNFGIHRESILRIDLMIRLKGGRNHFLGSKLDLKVPQLPKVHISQTTGCRKLLGPSK